MMKFLRRAIGAVIVFGIIGTVLWYTWMLWAVLAGAFALAFLFILGCWMLTAD